MNQERGLFARLYILDLAHKSISRNLTLSLGVIMIIFSIAVIGFSYGRSGQIFRQQVEEKADEYIITLTQMLEVPMWTYDRGSMIKVADVFSEYDLLVMIRILDNEGNTVFENSKLKPDSDTLHRSGDIIHDGQKIGGVEIEVSLEEYHQTLVQMLNMSVIYLAGSLLVMLITSGVLMDELLRKPLSALQSKIDDIARGNYSLNISEDQFIELLDIAQSFEKMAGDIQQREDSLRLAQFSIDHATDAIIWLEPEGKVIYANKAACVLSGYSKDEILAMGASNFVPQGSPESRETIWRELKDYGSSTFEVIRESKSGRAIPLEITANYVDFHGKAYVFTFCRDIRRRRQAEAALVQERTLLRTVIDNLPDAIYSKDLEGRKTLGNRADLENIGANDETSVLGKTDYEIYPIEMASAYHEEDLSIIETGQPIINKERHTIDALGRLHWFLTSKLPLRDNDGNVIGIIGIGRDITERKLMIQTISEREELLRTLINSLPDIICFKDGEGRWLEANDFYLRLLEIENVPYHGKKDSELAAYSAFYRDAFFKSQETDERAWKSKGLLRSEETITKSDGNMVILDVIKVPLFHDGGERKGLVMIGRDITERKKSNDALRESEARNRALLNVFPDLLFVYDKDGTYLDYNASDPHLLASPPENFLGKNIRDIVPNLADEVIDHIHRVLDEGSVESMEYTLYIDSTQYFFEGRFFPLDENRVLSIVRDVTARKVVEEELHQRNIEIGLLYEAGQQISRTLDFQVIYDTLYQLLQEIMDCDGLIVSSFNAITHMISITYARYDGTILDVAGIPPFPLDAERQGLQSTVIRSGKSMLLHNEPDYSLASLNMFDLGERMTDNERNMERPQMLSALVVPLFLEDQIYGVIQVLSYNENAYTENHLRILEVVASQVATASANALLFHQAQEEIMEREKTEVALGQERSLLRTLIEYLPVGVYTKDLEARKTLSNRTDLTFLGGQTEKDVLGKTDLELMPPDVGEICYQEDMNIIHTGQPLINKEELLYNLRGQSMWLQTTKLPLRNAEGEIIGLVGIGHDITERKRNEQQILELNAQLEQRVQERTAQLAVANQELEAFSYSVSHDLRAPLRSIDGFSAALEDDYGHLLDQQARRYVQRIRSASQHMAELIDNLLKLSRITRVEIRREQVDISMMCRMIIEELRTAQPGRIVEFNAPDVLIVDADPSLIQIVLSNLINNAWKFTSNHANANIVLDSMQKEEKQVVYVKDDGAGFDMAYADKLFAPFQRLHSTNEFEGTGIGLATVQRIIHRLGGKIWVESEVEKGTTIYFTTS